MRELLLLRHAKSDWSDVSLPDHDRPLSGRGRRAAPAMGDHLRDAGLVPDRVLCSSSRRTRGTWSGVSESLGDGPDPDVLIVEDLYLASPRTMIDLVHELGGSAERLMVIAHNPGTHDLAVSLAAFGEDRLLDRLGRKFPTGAIAVLEFEGDAWSAVRPGAGRLVDFVRPKDLEGAAGLGL